MCFAPRSTKKLKYGELWELVRQAAQLAIEDDNYSEMMRWLKEFIHQHKETLTRSVRSRDQDQNQDLSDNDEVDANKENEPQQVKNPLVSRRKGHPQTKRYKSATEKTGKLHAKYTCSTCGQSGHNSARCLNH